MQVKNQQLEQDLEQQTDSQLGKECIKAAYCHPAYLTLCRHIMQNAGLDESQARIKSARRNIYNLTYAGDTTLRAESKEEPKSLLKKVKEEREEACIKSKFKY